MRAPFVSEQEASFIVQACLFWGVSRLKVYHGLIRGLGFRGLKFKVRGLGVILVRAALGSLDYYAAEGFGCIPDMARPARI